MKGGTYYFQVYDNDDGDNDTATISCICYKFLYNLLISPIDPIRPHSIQVESKALIFKCS